MKKIDAGAGCTNITNISMPETYEEDIEFANSNADDILYQLMFDLVKEGNLLAIKAQKDIKHWEEWLLDKDIAEQKRLRA